MDPDANRRSSDINVIQGKVLVKETSLGVSNLIVTAFDIDQERVEEENFGNITIEPGPDFWNKYKYADRIGSDYTDERGSFSILYNDDAFRSNNSERRPDLLVVVTAPEHHRAERCPEVLHLSCGIRRNAGRVEKYVVWIPSDLLSKTGIPFPGSSVTPVEEPGEVIKKLVDVYERDTEIEDGLKTIIEKRASRKDQIKDSVKEKVQELIANVSKAPYESANNYPGVFVKPGENVEEVTAQVIARAVNTNIINFSLVKHVSVAEDQLPTLQDSAGNFRTDIPLEEVANILSRPHYNQNSQTLLGVDPLNLCQPQDFPYDQCPLPPDNGNGGNGHTQSNSALTKKDMPKFINRLIKNMTSPEKISFSLNGNGNDSSNDRASESDVQDAINDFRLDRGPADSASTFEFHHLQISFEHIWQQLLDDNISTIGTTVYTNLGLMGLDHVNINQNGGVLSDVDSEVDVLGEPDPEIVKFFHITKPEWLALNDAMRNELRKISGDIKLNTDYLRNGNVMRDAMQEQGKTWLGITMFAQELQWVANNEDISFPDSLTLRDAFMNHLREVIARDKRKGESIIEYAHTLVKSGLDPFSQVNNLIGELEKLLNENYQFTVYAADNTGRSINYGLDVVYRQKWEPVNYQVGKLIKTIPLAPKETRKFSKKVVTKKSKSVEEIEKNVRSGKLETSETYKAESEIVTNSQNKTNFNLTSSGTLTFKIISATVSNAFTKDITNTSNDVKKDYHDDVRKSSEEYQNTHEIKINSSESIEEEFQESGEINNPNDEIPVTYLFYELQRRYRVQEQIHKIVPVILVAQEVPKPNEIDNDWIIKNDWILNRVLLDDSYRPTLSYISTKITGDEFALKQLEENVEQQRKLVEDIKEELLSVRSQVGSRYAALGQSIQDKIAAAGTEESSSPLNQVQKALFGFSAGDIVGKLFGDDKDDSAVEAAKMREEAARDAFERAEREMKRVQDRLEREVTSLNALTETFTKAASEHMNRKVMVYRLRLHIKENILYYMQSIWNHEPPDQRFFRLHKVRVPKINGKIKYSTIKEDSSYAPLYPHWNRIPLEVNIKCEFDPIIPSVPDLFTTLAEVADLDNMLGYKGNYMIFPLKQSNTLTDFMMEPYKDPHTVLRDPDESGNWTLDKFEEYVCCLKKNLDPPIFDELVEGLEKKYDSLINSSSVQDEEIIIPSGSLFIEALPGKHPILEDFKLLHRAIDVKKAQAETRKAELENIRLAARVITEEYEDPDIEKKIVIEGDAEGTIVTPEDN